MAKIIFSTVAELKMKLSRNVLTRSWLCLLGLLTCTVRVRAEPPITPDQTTLRFDEIGIYEVGCRLRGGEEIKLPVGWTGGLDSPTGAACEEGGKQGGKNAWLLHCPWRGPTGVTDQTFTVALPTVPRVALAGSTALRTSAVGKSDGVTYRVFVDGEQRFEANRTDDAWKPFSIDLSAKAGQTVAIRFEVDPGPRDNSAFDFALWADRRLEMPGYSPSVRLRPTPPPLDLRAVSSRQNGDVVPLSGFPGKTTVIAVESGAAMRYEGTDGTLEYRWLPNETDALFGKITLTATLAGDIPVEVPVAAGARMEWIAPAKLLETRFSVPPAASGPAQTVVVTRKYAVGDQQAAVTSTATIRDKSLVLDVSCDLPVVRALDGGAWGPVMRRRALNLPYYSWPISYLVHENLFAGTFLDWTNSQASSHAGSRSTYDALTDGSRNFLHERLIYTAAWHLDETLPNLPRAPSPYREDLAHRVVLDIWGGGFSSVRDRLHTLADNGFGPGMAIIHDWQFGGYDNQLPQHVPANAKLGGDEAMRSLVQSARHDDIRVALHENYVDYYPNTPDFTGANIARASDGSRVQAWLNEGTKTQSFAVRPTEILPLAKSQGPEVARRYEPDACYLDVHSAVPPWFHVDLAAEQPGAGKFQTVRAAHEKLWDYERGLHAGPVLGEGNNHWYWSGALDGVEAQFGQGWRDGQGTDAPLLVDFDLLKIHPLQLNHGMGYYDRWWAQGPNPRRGLLSLLDQYRAQEIAYGHEGFLGGEAWHDPSCAWLESHLLPPVTTRTALANPVSIDYLSNDVWLDATATVKAEGSFAQVRVRYDNDLTVWANGGGQSMTIDGVTIPAHGWLARGDGLTAGTIIREGVVADQAETADSVFVNARPALDWQDHDLIRIRPSVKDFTPSESGKFRMSYAWEVAQTVKDDLQCFVHFVPAGADPSVETISFQQDHALTPPSSQWKAGQTMVDGPWTVAVPPNTASGDYQWTIGLFPRTGGRLALQGESDAHRRMILGTLHVAPDRACTFSPAPAVQTAAAPVNAENRALDFGSIRTDGSVFVQREGLEWTLRPFPTDRPFTVQLRRDRFGSPADAWVTHGWWQLPLTGEKIYRWPAH